MRTSAILIIISMFILAGCKTQQSATNLNNDDVYYQKHASSKPANESTAVTEDLSATKNIPTDTAGINQAGSSKFEQDYNDYSSRIQRFSHGDKDHGYYDEIYSKSDGSDTTISNANVNIYLGDGGYSNWGSSFSFGFGWGSGWYPYDSYYPYYGYYYPYCGWYSTWGWPYYGGSYWNGYYDGYYTGYWDGYYGYPYNSYPNSYYSYYGRRDMLYTNGSGTGSRNSRSSVQPVQDAALRNDRTGSSVKNDRTTIVPATAGRSGDINPAVAPANRETTAAINNTTRINPASSSGSARSTVQKEQYRYTRTQKQSNSTPYQRSANQSGQRENVTPRYVRPTNSVAESRNGYSQSYSSPAYRQPKSSQEYINPRPQTSGTGSSSRVNTNGRSYSNSSNSSGRYSSPSNSTNSTRQYSSPSNSESRSYTPSRSNSSSGYSSPSRSSSPSYSSPSRSSSPSYSAPSRSGGGSGSGSGSSGGGGRRK